MKPTRPLGVQWPSVRALKKIDEHRLPCSPIFDDNIWRWRYYEVDRKYVRKWQVRRRGWGRIRRRRKKNNKESNTKRLQADNSRICSFCFSHVVGNGHAI